MFNNKFNSNPKQAVLLMLISDYLDICDPVLTFDRFMGEIGGGEISEKYTEALHGKVQI